MITFFVVLLSVWVVYFFFLFVNGNKQLNLLFICRPFLSGFADILKFNGNICLVGWVLLHASIWGNGWLSPDVRLDGFCWNLQGPTPVYLSKPATVFLFPAGNEMEQQAIRITKERMKTRENLLVLKLFWVSSLAPAELGQKRHSEWGGDQEPLQGGRI